VISRNFSGCQNLPISIQFSSINYQKILSKWSFFCFANLGAKKLLDVEIESTNAGDK
jgi:hypothetical protein